MRKRRKSGLMLGLFLVLVLAMTACGGESDPNKQDAASPSASTESSPTPSNSPSSSPESESDYTTYQNKDAGISIDYPKDWTVQDSDGTLAFLSPHESDEDAFMENVNIQIDDMSGENYTLDQYTELALEQIKQVITDVEIVSSETVKGEGDEADVHILEYTGRHGEFHLRWRQLMLVDGGLAYVLTYTAEEDSFNKYVEMFGEMAGSFIYGA